MKRNLLSLARIACAVLFLCGSAIAQEKADAPTPAAASPKAEEVMSPSDMIRKPMAETAPPAAAENAAPQAAPVAATEACNASATPCDSCNSTTACPSETTCCKSRCRIRLFHRCR